MNVENVVFGGRVLYGPVFDSALVDDDAWWLASVIGRRGLTGGRDEKCRGAVGIAGILENFGKLNRPLCYWCLVHQIGKACNFLSVNRRRKPPDAWLWRGLGNDVGNRPSGVEIAVRAGIPILRYQLGLVTNVGCGDDEFGSRTGTKQQARFGFGLRGTLHSTLQSDSRLWRRPVQAGPHH